MNSAIDCTRNSNEENKNMILGCSWTSDVKKYSMMQNVKQTKYAIRHQHVVQYINLYDRLHVDQNTIDYLNK